MIVVRLLTRAALALAVSVALLAGPSGVVLASADTQMTTTASLNVRSGPSLQSSVIGGLYRGQSVSTISAANGWTRIRFGSSTAYVASRYLTGTAPAPATTTGQVRTTTAALNLRRGPGLSYAVITVLPNRTQVRLTGTAARGFVEVTHRDTTGWVSAQYLSAAAGLPTVIGTRVATADLLVRTTSGEDFEVVAEVPTGTRLSVTGTTQNGRAQIIFGNEIRWVTARYLTNLTSNQPSVPPLPRIVGVRYATAPLLIRSSSSDVFTTITEVPIGTALDITGVVRNARSEIVFRGAVRWVTGRYLTSTPPSTGVPASWAATERNLRPNAVALHRSVRRTWPQITTIYGWRQDVTPDHPAGKALDLMIPDYRTASGRALGDRVAEWARTNHASLKIEYIIWDQQIWNVRRASEGWRYMASRGSDSANHKDHVHITVLD